MKCPVFIQLFQNISLTHGSQNDPFATLTYSECPFAIQKIRTFLMGQIIIHEKYLFDTSNVFTGSTPGPFYKNIIFLLNQHKSLQIDNIRFVKRQPLLDKRGGLTLYHNIVQKIARLITSLNEHFFLPSIAQVLYPYPLPSTLPQQLQNIEMFNT